MIRVLIADDHSIVRDGLAAILEIKGDIRVSGHAGNGREAVSAAKTLKPDIVLMDIAMPEMNGIEATRRICQDPSAPRVIILSMFNTSEHIFRAFDAGASGYLLKESAGSEVFRAIAAVMAGRRYISEKIPFRDMPDTSKSPLSLLSNREMQIIQLVVEGKSSADIGSVLSISPKSVETYRSRLMRKLGVKGMPELIKFAVQYGLTSLSSKQ